MKEKINEICSKLNRDQLSVYGATEALFNLFSLGKLQVIDSILEDMDGKDPEYHREIVESYLDDDC